MSFQNLLLEVVEQLDSTTAELLRRKEVAAGTALLALTQTGGRGRSERVWESPRGGMYLSVALRVAEPQGLSLLGALALLDLLTEAGVRGQLRWPNDVTVQTLKLGGVLPVVRYAGNRLERAVLGVGLNVSTSLEVFEPELRSTLTTLDNVLPGREWDVVEVARSYLKFLEARLQLLEEKGLAAIVALCQPRLEGVGDGRLPVLVGGVESKTLAPVVSLDSDGALRLADGSRLEGLGRDQRLRFIESDPPTSPHA